MTWTIISISICAALCAGAVILALVMVENLTRENHILRERIRTTQKRMKQREESYTDVVRALQQSRDKLRITEERNQELTAANDRQEKLLQQAWNDAKCCMERQSQNLCCLVESEATA